MDLVPARVRNGLLDHALREILQHPLAVVEGAVEGPILPFLQFPSSTALDMFSMSYKDAHGDAVVQAVITSGGCQEPGAGAVTGSKGAAQAGFPKGEQRAAPVLCTAPGTARSPG